MILDIIQLILAILLTGAVLIQAQGTGLGGVFGSEGGIYRTKRGAEKKLHTTTVVLAILFMGVALTNVLS